MNSSIGLRDGYATPAPPLVWCVWPISYIFTQSYRMLLCTFLSLVAVQLGGLNVRAFSTGAALTYIVVHFIVATHFWYATTPAHDGDVFAMSLALQHAQYGVMLWLLAASTLPQPKYIDLRAFYSVCVYCVYAVCMIMQYISLAGPASNLGSSSLVSALCDASTGLCKNPCEDMVLPSSTFREPDEELFPVIWSVGNAAVAQASKWSVTNQWIVDAAKTNDSTCEELIKMLWWTHFLVGPLYQCLRGIALGSPKDVRNRIFRRLQQDYRPRLQGESERKRFLLQLLVWTRYAWILLGMVSMDIRIFQHLTRLASWGYRRIYKLYMEEDPISFESLVVLEYNPSPQRRMLAKYLAVSWYLWSLAFIILFPSFCLFITIRSELNISEWIPQKFTFYDQGQWVVWAMFGAATVIYSVWYLVFEVALKRGLETIMPPDSDRKKIYIADPTVDEDGPEMIALLEKNIQDNDLSWPKYVAARVILEWVEFKYWWRHPSTDIKPQKDVDPWKWDDTWRRGGGRGEIQNWTAFPNELPSYPSSSRYIPLAPEPKMTVDYSYDDEEETQKLLYEREGRRRRRG